MTTLRKRLTATGAILLALTITPALSGCFGGNPVEGIIEGVTGGEVSLPGAGVPQDFPSDVPLIDGEVLVGGGLGTDEGKIWNVTIRVSGPEALEQIKAQFAAAGYETQDGSAIPGGTTGALFTKDKIGALVVLSTDDKGHIASYTVTRSNS